MALFLAFFEMAPRVGIVDARFLPPFSKIAQGFAELVVSNNFWVAFGQTVTTWLLGFLIAAVGGTLLGLLIGSFAVLTKLTHSTIEFLRPIPSVALIPIAILIFGTGRGSTLLIVIYATLWIVLVQVIHGVQDVDPVVRDTARTYQFSPLSIVRKVIWPTTLPYTVTGLRIGTSVALILAVTGELIIGTPGLGKLLALARSGGAVATIYALVIVTGLIEVGANLITRGIERRVLHWHTSLRLEGVA